MKENPDNKHYLDFGPQSKQVNSEGEELSLDMRYLIPQQHQLRFVKRQEGPTQKAVCHLQQYQWCMEKSEFGWYDIPLVEE